MSQPDGAPKVAELVDQARISMFTTMTGDGRQVSRPMALQEVEFDGDLWFFCYDDSDKVTQIETNPQVNVAFSDTKNSSWTSVSGTADLVRDRAQMERLWAAPLRVWFPDGLDTDGIALLKVHADSAEWWESSRSKVVQLVGAVRAADPDKFPGDNAETKL